jgi:hypothetical protein
MRRRRTPTPRPKPAPEPVDPRLEKQYHTHNPMRDNGHMPHEEAGDGFIEYLILNGMTEDTYWLNVESGEEQAADIEEHGIPIPTDKLTDDQKGWAKAEHFDHFLKETARWRPVPDKESKVVPYRFAPKLRDREYRTQCDDGSDAKLELWGYRWDLKELFQCQTCGEVIIKSPFTKAVANNDNGDNNDNDD